MIDIIKIMKYIPRIADNILREDLAIFGAVQISGPKFCGKTETAKQFAKSQVNLQTDNSVANAMASDPHILLLGAVPRLIDEWQEYPQIRNVIRHEVDERQIKGQFILTGSATPNDATEARLHSGAGRMSRMHMRTMTWSEIGWSNGHVKLKDILTGKRIKSEKTETSVQDVTKHLVIGGWPEYIYASEEVARRKNRAYVATIIESDISRVSGVNRDPARVRSIFESYARNISTPAKVSTIVSDASKQNGIELDRKTVTGYLDDLTRLMIVDDLPAWNTHIRSSAKLRSTPKRHLVDPSLAAAILNLSSDALIKDLNYTGFLFESQVVHDLRVCAEALEATTYYYRDSDGDEVDIIVETPNHKFAAFEVKLGIGSVEEAVESLIRFKNKLTDKKQKDLISLNVIVSSGFAATRPDGINVIPLDALGV
jgi:predicted AAA+ superfamily ATPase